MPRLRYPSRVLLGLVVLGAAAVVAYGVLKPVLGNAGHSKPRESGRPQGVLIVAPRSPKCSDSRSVSRVNLTSPWCSIQRAFQAAPAGSVVQLRGGVYPLQQLHGAYHQPPRLTSYVTFEPYGYGTSSPEAVTINGLNLQNTGYLRFEGLHLAGSDSTSLILAAYIGPGTQNVQLVNDDISGQGIEDLGASNVLLQGNHIHNITSNCTLTTAFDGAGIWVGNSPSQPPITNIQILDNQIVNTTDDALDLANAANVLVQSNDMSTVAQAQAPCGRHVDLVQIENRAQGPITIKDNYFHDGNQFILRNATGLTLQNNLIVRMTNWMQLVADPAAKIINNTWWGNQGCNPCGLLIRGYAPGSGWTLPPFNYTNTMAGTVIENNIIRAFSNDSVPASQYTEDYNLIYGSRQGSTGIQGSHTTFATPTFLNPTATNYQLAPGSPGSGSANSNVAPPLDMLGNPRTPSHEDIGALQRKALDVPRHSRARPARGH